MFFLYQPEVKRHILYKPSHATDIPVSHLVGRRTASGSNHKQLVCLNDPFYKRDTCYEMVIRIIPSTYTLKGSMKLPTLAALQASLFSLSHHNSNYARKCETHSLHLYTLVLMLIDPLNIPIAK